MKNKSPKPLLAKKEVFKVLETISRDLNADAFVYRFKIALNRFSKSKDIAYEQQGFVFDRNILNAISGKAEFTIGIDTFNKSELAYCLVVNCNNKTTILLAKTMNNQKAFDEEVNNLSKYFNAKIIEEL